MPLRNRLMFTSVGLLLVSFIIAVATSGRNFTSRSSGAAWAWLEQATLWLGLFTALATLAAWIVDERK